MGDVTYWRKASSERLPNAAVDAFIRDIVMVYKKHGMSISHEDGHGAFIIEDYCNINIQWLADASVDIKG